MSSTLRKDTILAFIWNAIDKLGAQIVLFVIGVITARILSPKDFGLIGALSIFTILSNILVESGFSAALIRRRNVSDEEYTAVLYFNIILSLFLYLILFFSAPYIAQFFNLPELTALARVLFISIIFNAFGIVQTTKSTIELNFKLLSIANISAIILSGVISVWMAIAGFSYWAIAAQQVLMVLFRVVFLWLYGNYKITSKTDFSIIKKSFLFSGNLLITSVINVVATNIYNIIIGKIYTLRDLGYYAQAQKYQMIPSTIINNTLQGVAYPMFTKLNDDNEKQLFFFRKLLRVAAFLIFPAMIGLYAMAEELVVVILTAKWLPAVEYFKILILASLVFPFRVLSLNLLIARGKSKLYMYLELTKNALIFLFIFVSWDHIIYLLIGYTAANFISFLINIYFVSKHINYRIIDFIKDISPYLILSTGIFFYVYLIKQLDLGIYLQLIIEIIGSCTYYFISLKLLKSKVFEDVLNMLKGKL